MGDIPQLMLSLSLFVVIVVLGNLRVEVSRLQREVVRLRKQAAEIRKGARP